MSAFFYWRYRLKLRDGGILNAVSPDAEIEGALVRDWDGGHGCLQPWSSLGQGTLEDSLAVLKSGGESGLVDSCRRCMTLDTTFRTSGRSVFNGKLVPRSHLSVPSSAKLNWLEENFSQGFHLFKVKGEADINQTAAKVRRLIAHFGDGLRLRIDFNECLEVEGIREFVSLLGQAAEQVDFFEDPVPYDASVWTRLREELGVDMAVDRASEVAREGFAVRVVKPAWEPVLESGDSRIVYTSAMDHPIGQMFAAAEAADSIGEVEDCGLLTHWLFEPNEFSEALEVDDRRLIPPKGSGLGFDDLLDGLPWKKL